MDQSLAKFHGQLIKNAQILFKLSLGFSATLPELGYLSSFASYRHTAYADELKLTREEEGVGSTLSWSTSRRILWWVQIDTALGALYPTRFESADQMLRSAAWIARLVRNSFAHNPFAPKWKTYSECENQQFSGRHHFIGHNRFERQVCRPRTLRRSARTVKAVGVYSGKIRARLSHTVRPCRTALIIERKKV